MISSSMLELLLQLQRGNTTAFGYTQFTLGKTYVNGNTVKALIRRGLLEQSGEMVWSGATALDGHQLGNKVPVYSISRKGQELLLDLGYEIQIEVKNFKIDPRLIEKALDLEKQERLDEWKKSLSREEK